MGDEDMSFGYELILDLRGCEQDKFERVHIKRFMEELCTLLKMQRGPLHFWDYEPDDEARRRAPENLAGISAVQFISTSNITIHTLDHGGRVYLNIFSCQDFSVRDATGYCQAFFGGDIVSGQTLVRK